MPVSVCECVCVSVSSSSRPVEVEVERSQAVQLDINARLPHYVMNQWAYRLMD
jgi:hypothetical protein